MYQDANGYHFWYTGGGTDDGSGNCQDQRAHQGIGYASSSDGKTWVKDATNPIFHVTDGATYRNDRTYTPAVVDDGSGILRMYYSAQANGGPKKIGLAMLSLYIEVYIDIKPQSCPNPLNINSRGVLPVAILGTEDLDVADIDPSSIQLAGVAPLRWTVEDVSTPIDNQDVCDCSTEGSDGFDDLTFKFDTQEIVAALGGVADGDVLLLTLTGELYDGTPIEGGDCILILSIGNKGRSR